MTVVDKIRQQIRYIFEQLECIKNEGCLCYAFETDLSFNPDSGILSATFVDNSTRSTVIDVTGIINKIPIKEDENDEYPSLFTYHPAKGNNTGNFIIGETATNGWVSQNEFGKLLVFTGQGDGSGETMADWDVRESI